MSNYHGNHTQWFYFPNRHTFGYIQDDGIYWIVNGGWGDTREGLESTYGSSPVMMVPTHCMLIDQLDDYNDQCQLIETLYHGHIGIYPKPDDLALFSWSDPVETKPTLGNFSLEDF